ncbi:MAG: adenosylcobinamide-phosphate synthase CbiB [Nitrospirota bacterium]
MITPPEIVLAFLLDAALGDPRWLPHPVRLMGRAVAWLEGRLRGAMRQRLRLAGVVLVALVVGGVLAGASLLMGLLRLPQGGPWAVAASAAVVWLASSTLALRGLIQSVGAVFKSASLGEARAALSHIVGRDVSALDRDGVERAAIETLAENASDGVIAPLFYLALGGVPLALAYKAVNTLDSMVGYRNERYGELGWAAARLDDLANYVPARLTGLLLVAAAALLPGGRAGRALATFLRDGRAHKSPNSGMPEAAMAGALGVRLGGPSTYGGLLVEKPFIGGEMGGDYHAQWRRAAALTVGLSLLGLALAVLGIHMRGLLWST